MNYPEFIEDKEYIQMDASISENQQLRAMLDNLTKVHLLSANKFESLDDLIRTYLHAGIEIFGLETGIVSHVDQKNIYHVLDVISPLNVLEKGQTFPLQDTYCREVVKSRRVLGFPQVGKLDYMNCHPVYQNLKLEAYLSAPIYVKGKIYGTLNFTSTQPRQYGFSKNEYNLILLMANAIGNYILLRSKQKHLQNLNDKMKRFVGYVAHDLRNPIGGIIGLTNLMERHVGNPNKMALMLPKIRNTAQDTLELVNKILDIAAISAGKLVLDVETVSLMDIYRSSESAVSDFAFESEVTLSVEMDMDIEVKADPKRIQKVLVNLLINSIKYSPAGSTVQTSVSKTAENCDISVRNTMADSGDLNAHAKGIYDSVGFGMEIVETILKAHQSELRVDQNNHLYTASFKIPI
jgi:signal transduction histidine kinase